MKVRIVGVGFSHELDLPDDASLAVAIGEANIDAGNLTARVNGETVQPQDYELSEGDTVVLSPPDVKLG